MAEKKHDIDSVELLLSGSILNTPITVSAALNQGKDGKNLDLWGSAAYRKSVADFLRDLAGTIDKASGNKLAELLGEQGKIIQLETLGFGYRTEAPRIAQFIVTMKSAGGNRCVFTVIKKMEGGFAISAVLETDTAIGKNNPLAALTGQIDIKQLGIHYASQELLKVPEYPPSSATDSGFTPINLPGGPGRNYSLGVQVSAQILIEGVDLFSALSKAALPSNRETSTPVPAATSPSGNGENNSSSTLPSADSLKWIEAGKVIGPLSLRRVGLGYQAPRVTIKLDAGLNLSCLAFSLEGLGFSYPIDQFSTDPATIWNNIRFYLDGASLSFSQGPLAITGGLLKSSDQPLQLDGTLLVKTPMLAISALASYANLNGEPSFFMFAALHKELGGPAFFFITGLAFGFGVNRTLKLPSIYEVQNYPLIRAATDDKYLGEKLDLRAVSQKLGQYISPSIGEYWIAAGVKFSSFGQIESFALLSVSFGARLEFALLGLSTLKVPKLLPGSSTASNVLPVIVYAELAMRAVVSTDSGLLFFEARLTENSYLLRKDFKLRGGFAFYSWYSGPHEGDFVVSIGGYHNKFKLPAHYPRPDLVMFSCKIGDVTIQGDCYFALCPSAIMAGGRLSIVYQTSNVRAWFIAYAHFLIQWKPVYYDISIGVSVGVALNFSIGVCRVNLSIELSATLDMYGPPLGGRATISLYIITFAVSFGEDRQLPPPLAWESTDPEKSFAKAFLPNPEVNRATITAGLLKSFDDLKSPIPALVNPHQLVVNCNTVVPATEIVYNEETLKAPDAVNNRLGIRPMNQSSLYSRLIVTLASLDDPSPKAAKHVQDYTEISLIHKSVPMALWSNTPLDLKSPPERQMIDNTLAGLVIVTKPGPRSWEIAPAELETFKFDIYDKHADASGVEATKAFAANNRTNLENLGAIMEPAVADRRKAIVAILRGKTQLKAKNPDQRLYPDSIGLSQLAMSAQSIFQVLPEMATVGQEPPRTHI